MARLALLLHCASAAASPALRARLAAPTAAAPRPHGRAALARASLDALSLLPARGKQLDAAAAFFADAFWGAATNGAAPADLTPRGRAALAATQLADLEQRYGALVGARRLASELIVARAADGALAGCVGLELAVVSVAERLVLPRTRGEQMFRQKLDAMSARERNEYRKLPLQELAALVLEPGYGVCPLLANLAVGEAHRGSGLGRELCFRAEDLALEWGYGGIVLQVEEGNAPAVGLYKSLGYCELFVNEQWPALRAQPDGELVTEPVNLLTLTKSLV
ncbi:hypothetical protein AB1Y20_020318 [Prymnesium parvum]|uniref:N-acetyltransferase domain-containing protein n=1 Tax=Prymnesium parvum TaxID=97485 RepID=A0AB34JWY8_PRYPA